MAIDKFIQLSESEKISTLLNQGDYLIHFHILEQTFILFKLWDFYVEVLCNQEGILALRPFNNSQDLIPYLDVIQAYKPL